MKVRILKNIALLDGTPLVTHVKKGDVVEVSPELGLQLIADKEAMSMEKELPKWADLTSAIERAEFIIAHPKNYPVAVYGGAGKYKEVFSILSSLPSPVKEHINHIEMTKADWFLMENFFDKCGMKIEMVFNVPHLHKIPVRVK